MQMYKRRMAHWVVAFIAFIGLSTSDNGILFLRKKAVFQKREWHGGLICISIVICYRAKLIVCRISHYHWSTLYLTVEDVSDFKYPRWNSSIAWPSDLRAIYTKIRSWTLKKCAKSQFRVTNARVCVGSTAKLVFKLI